MRRTSCLFALLLCAPPVRAAEADLAAAAGRAMHGFMVLNPERLPSRVRRGELPEGHYRFYFGAMGLPVPQLAHSQWDLGDCTGRAVQAWLFARRMTGDTTFGRNVEQGQQALLLSLLDPGTGLVAVPELGDPATGAAYFQMWDQGRTLRALVRWWLEERDPGRRARLRAAINHLIAGADRLAFHGTDPKCGDYAVYRGDAFVGGKPRDDLCIMRGGQLLEPLALYWAASRNAAALRLAEQVCAGVLSGREADGYKDWLAATLRFGSDGSFTGHFHDHASIALGVARFGVALVGAGQRERGLELLRWARRVYDWTLSPANVNAGGSFGWFPENNDGGTSARQISEVCCLADMIELAAALAGASRLDPSLAGNDALWDHVERYAVNTLLASQFRVTPAYARLLRAHAGERTLYNAFVSLELDPNGAFSHEAVGHQTLADAQGGHLSQTLYAVRYDGRTAGLAYGPGPVPTPRGLRILEPTRREGGALLGRVTTEDGALDIASRTELGRGPYATRELTLKNTTGRPLEDVRLACVANLDFPQWSRDAGRAEPEAGRVVVTASDGAGRAAVAGVPRPDYVCAGDALGLLGSLDRFEWPQQPARMQGNAAGLVGWRLGTLAPGDEKRVRVVLAIARTDAELARALAGETFPGSDGAADPAALYLKTARRMEGGFIACAYPNDLVYTRDDGTPSMHWMGCCQYAGVTGLYAAWEPAFAETPGALSVRLPLNRKGRLAEQRVEERAGQVVRTISLRSACRVEVRVPDWADMGKVRARVSAPGKAGRALRPQVAGRWLRLGRLAAGMRLVVTYPLAVWTTRERVGGSNRGDGFCPPAEKVQYTIRWRGNRVESLDPPGRYLPVP